MLWFILSLMTVLSVATHDAWVKKFFSNLSTYEMLVYPLIYSLPLLLVILPFIPLPHLDSAFLWAFLISLPINGGFIFKEKNVAMRTIGTLLMVAGVVLITMKGK